MRIALILCVALRKARESPKSVKIRILRRFEFTQTCSGLATSDTWTVTPGAQVWQVRNSCKLADRVTAEWVSAPPTVGCRSSALRIAWPEGQHWVCQGGNSSSVLSWRHEDCSGEGSSQGGAVCRGLTSYLLLEQTHCQGNPQSQAVLGHQSGCSPYFRSWQELTSWSSGNDAGNFAFFSDHFWRCACDLWNLQPILLRLPTSEPCRFYL